METFALRGRGRDVSRCASLTSTFAMVLFALCSGCSGPRPTPIAYHPITIEGHCAQREEDGFREDARLSVIDNRVRALDWQLWVGQRGSCRFAFDDFRQTRERPHVELVARDDRDCKLMVWQEPRRITLAHTGCAARCTPGVYDEAWPVSFDPSSGACAIVQ